MQASRSRPGIELLLLAAWLLATLPLRPLMLPDEGRYAGVAWEMLQGSPWLPTLDGLPFFHKPPLLYWADMAAMSVFGAGAFAARLGPALFGWCLGAALFFHARRWHGADTARVVLVVLATSPLFFFGAQYVNHDVGVAACITAAVLAFVRAVDDPGAVSGRWRLAAWAACGVGVLAKGLIGVVLPLAVVLPWLLAQRRWRQAVGLFHPAGLLAGALVALPWLWAMQQRHRGFFDYFIVEQHFRRFAGMRFNNVQPFWFFWLVLPLTLLPWSLWLFALRPARRVRVDPKLGLYLWWVLVIVGFFSLPASKLAGYVMPALAPAAALLALQRGGRWLGWAAAAAALCLAAIIGLAWKGPVGHADIARELALRWQDGDRLVFVEEHPYDLRFLAGIRNPAIVVTDWADPELPRHDNWRKELADAARFAPHDGAARLWTWAQWPQIACHAGRTWVVAAAEYRPQMAGLQPVMSGRHGELWQAGRETCRPGAAPQ